MTDTSHIIVCRHIEARHPASHWWTNDMSSSVLHEEQRDLPVVQLEDGWFVFCPQCDYTHKLDGEQSTTWLSQHWEQHHALAGPVVRQCDARNPNGGGRCQRMTTELYLGKPMCAEHIKQMQPWLTRDEAAECRRVMGHRP